MDRWLESRLAQVPPTLRRRVEDVLRTEDRTMRAAAEVLLAEAASAPPSRETALALLAADALMTYVCEWVADSSPETLGEMQ